MRKSVCLFAIFVVISTGVAPLLHAERAGTNPHPQTATSTIVQVIASTVCDYLGI